MHTYAFKLSCTYYSCNEPIKEERGGSTGGQRGCRGGLRGPGAAQGCAWYACQVWGGAVTVGPSCARMPNFSVKVGQMKKWSNW